MTNINRDKNSDFRKLNAPESSFGPRVDSQALQDIIAVMKGPLMVSCDTCNGLGFIKSGEDCPTCYGSGKVLDEFFK